MWQGILTETHIGKEDKPDGSLLVVIRDENIGDPNPDPDAAWREAEDYLEQVRDTKPEGTMLDICIRPSSYQSYSGRPGLDLIFKDPPGTELVFK